MANISMKPVTTTVEIHMTEIVIQREGVRSTYRVRRDPHAFVQELADLHAPRSGAKEFAAEYRSQTRTRGYDGERRRATESAELLIEKYDAEELI